MNKNFETLEKVLIHMADNVYQPVEFPKYIDKLEKEFAELMAELNHHYFDVIVEKLDKNEFNGHSHFYKVKDELADVLCFLIRISNKLQIPANELMHHAITKMVQRLADPNYNRL